LLWGSARRSGVDCQDYGRLSEVRGSFQLTYAGRGVIKTVSQTNANLIWKIADLLRGPYQPNQYGDVMARLANGTPRWP
jgi:hypothetical protein